MGFLKSKMLNSDLGMLLSLGSLVGYGCYYAKELSFNSYYRLPVRYIDFNLQGLAFTVFIVIAVTCVLALLIHFLLAIVEIVPYLKNKKSELESILQIMAVISVLVVGVLKVSGFINTYKGWGYWLDLIVYGGMMWAFIRAIKFAPPFFTVMAVILYALIIAMLSGSHSATNKENYLILKRDDKQNYVVINNYNDQFVIAPVDLKKKIIYPKFQFIEMKSEPDKKLELSLEHTGQLKVEKYVN